MNDLILTIVILLMILLVMLALVVFLFILLKLSYKEAEKYAPIYPVEAERKRNESQKTDR